MYKFCCVVFFSLFCFAASAQKQVGSVTINSDPRLDSLIEQNIDHNRTADGIDGYRIQIYFGSERKGANDARTKFLQENPEIEAYLIYQQPYFKVRVGDYRNKWEANALYKQLLTEFDRVFIIPDKINLPKL